MWAVNGANIYSLGAQVGVGTVNPFFGKFEVRSAGTSDAVISIYGINAGTTGQLRGFYGEVASTDGIGAVGINNATTGVARAFYGESHGNQGIAGYFVANSATGSPRGVYGEAINTANGIGVFGIGANIGVQGQSLTPGVGWAGVFYGNTYTGGNVIIESGSVGIGTASPSARFHVKHTTDFDARLEGADESVVTLRLLETVGGTGDFGGLIRYDGLNNILRIGTVSATTETIALNIARGSTNVAVVGTLSKGGGTFKIDHPLDPENKYLYHSFVESPDMMNVYNGNIVTDARGYATITLPAYFEALNKDFRYQLTVIDGADENSWSLVKVATEIANNEFTLRSSTPNTKVSWQVTGVRKDAFANANRVVPEVEKEPENKGLYQHPDVFGMPTEKGIFGPHPAKPAHSADLNHPASE
jgi:hypothetical protein